MSTLKTTTLSNTTATKTIPVETVVAGSAKAWVNFLGVGTEVIRASFNVNSIVSLGDGYWRVVFAANMPSTNYCVVGTGGVYATGETISVGAIHARNNATTSVDIGFINPANGLSYDIYSVNVAIFSN